MRAMIPALAALIAATAACGEEPLSGQWIAISAAENGAAADDLVGQRLTFDGDAFRIVDTEGEVVSSGTFATDPAAEPATIDFTVTTGPGGNGPASGSVTAACSRSSRTRPTRRGRARTRSPRPPAPATR